MRIFGAGAPDETTRELLDYAAEFDALSIEASERISRFRQYRAEMDQARDLGMRDRMMVGDSDYGRRRGVTEEAQRHRIPIPMGRALTVKHAYRISGQLPDVVVDRREESPAERYRSDTMEKIVWSVLHASGGETVLSSGAWDASETGAACFDLYWDFKTEMPLLRRCDPAGILVVTGVDDPHDFQRVYRSWDVPLRSLQSQYAKGHEFRGQPVDVAGITKSFDQGNLQMVRVVQLSDKERTIRFAHGVDSSVGLYEYVHDLGFAPYIVIPNVGPYDEIWGWADYEFVRALSHYNEALLSREADVLRQVANGAVIEKATGQNPDQIRKAVREGGVIPSRRDGSIEPVQAAEMPAFHESHSTRVMEMLKMVGFAPDAAWGKPGSSSGTDRGLMLQPLLEYTAMKQLNWGKGLSRAFGYAYQMIEKKMVTTVNYRGTTPGQGKRRDPFNIQLGPNAGSDDYASGDTDPTTGEPVIFSFPKNPKELFDGDFCCRFVWNTRIDPDDPSFVTSEVAKFTSGVQSLETTLERLGFQAPEDEMRRIEAESERFPWINNGLVQLIKQQIAGANQQGQGGGNPGDSPADNAQQAATMMQGQGGGSGAFNADAMGQMTPGPGTQYGGA